MIYRRRAFRQLKWELKFRGSLFLAQISTVRSIARYSPSRNQNQR